MQAEAIRLQEDAGLRSVTDREFRRDSWHIDFLERFGNVAHVFSSYESFRRGETKPFTRGINSIQLVWDGRRWWVLSIFWDSERPDQPIPAEFVPNRQ